MTTKLHGRGCDCDPCFYSREHAKHGHCLDCRACLGWANRSSKDGDRCTTCAPCDADCRVHSACIERGDEDVAAEALARVGTVRS